MIHLIVFLIKIIVKAINGNKSNVPITGNNSYNNSIDSSNQTTTADTNTSANFSSPSSVTVSNKKKKSDDEKMIYSFLIAVFTSCCCGLGFFINFILAIILKKVPHILGTLAIAIAMVACFYMYMKEDEKVKEKASTADIIFNDTLRLNINNPEEARGVTESFLAHKYAAWYSDSNELGTSMSLNMMTYTLFAHKFDTLLHNNEIVTDKTIDEVLYGSMEVSEEVTAEDTDTAPQAETETASDNGTETSTTTNIAEETVSDPSLNSNELVVYLQEKDHYCLTQDEIDLREGKYSKKSDKVSKLKDNVYIYPLGILALITLIYSFFLWYSFFNRDKDENKDMIDSMNSTRSKPQSSTTYTSTPKPTITPPAASIPKANPSTQRTTTNPSMDQSGKKIAINTVDVYNLMTIPGLNYSTALLIISERTNNGKYSSLEDIKNRNSLSADMFIEISRYVYIN
ncbi:MAG: helix-hairpin-helix domain-containing protein [Bacteroidota bacterium]